MTSNTSSQAESKRLDQALADAVRLVWNLLLKMQVEQRLRVIPKCRAILDAIETQTIASQIDAGVPARKIEDIIHRAGAGGASKRTVKKKTARAAAVSENPALATQMAKGNLSEEQADNIAHASSKTGGEAANDTELIAKIAAVPPEQGKKIADEYINDRLSQDGIDTAHTRARKRRRVCRYSNSERGTDVLSIEGAPADIDAIEAHIDHLADQFYKADGGRAVGNDQHRRTRDQRRFDAASAFFASNGGEPNETSGEPSADLKAEAGKVAKAPQATWKTTFVIRASLDQATGNDPSPPTLIDGTPLPTSMIERLACGADFLGQIFGANGEILHHGRALRDATYAQRMAIVVRDGGCVTCRAPLSRCVIHHLKPWTSRLLGETNVDEMVMVCNDCHHHIHDNNLTMFQDNTGIWRLRKATKDELPANGPPRPPSPGDTLKSRQAQRRARSETPEPDRSPPAVTHDTRLQRAVIQQE